MTVRAAVIACALLVVALLVVALTAATWRTFTVSVVVSAGVSVLVVKWRPRP